MDHFEPGAPFRLTGSQLCPDISGGPGSAKSDEAQRRLLVAMAARRQLHDNFLCLDRVVEAGLLEDKKYEADLVRLVARLSVDGWSELARPMLDAFVGALEAHVGGGGVVPWGLEGDVDPERQSSRPRWMDRLEVMARGLRLVFIEAASPATVAAELDVPWPMELPWPPSVAESGVSAAARAGSPTRRSADRPALLGAR